MNTNTETVVNGWAKRFPDLAGRLVKAALIAEEKRVFPTFDPNVFMVRGDTGHYLVTRKGRGESTCTCPDFLQRGMKCKHRLACAILAVDGTLPKLSIRF